MQQTYFFTRPQGRIAYSLDLPTDSTRSHLLVASPGLGDLRSTYRDLTPILTQAGFTVATADLRGHGESDASFADYGDLATAGDLLSLAVHLGEQAAAAGAPYSKITLIGNSIAAGASVIAAAQAPETISSAVLLGPFVRPVPMSRASAIAMSLAMRKPWGPAAWKGAYGSFFGKGGAKPEWFASQANDIRDWLKKPGAWRALLATIKGADHSTVVPFHEAAARVPQLAIMGELDPDFPDPEAELDAIAGILHAKKLLLSGVGHYPQAQAPRETADAIIQFLDETDMGSTTDTNGH